MESPQGLESGAECGQESPLGLLCERGHLVYIEGGGGGLAPHPCKEGEREESICMKRGHIHELSELLNW